VHIFSRQRDYYDPRTAGQPEQGRVIMSQWPGRAPLSNGSLTGRGGAVTARCQSVRRFLTPAPARKSGNLGAGRAQNGPDKLKVEIRHGLRRCGYFDQ
jgi:hypothetical protein